MTTTDHPTDTLAGRNVLAGVLLGVGIAAFVDEVVFHQLLHWHHFYDRATPDIGLVSDGVLHAVGWFATVASLFLLADLRRRHAWERRRWTGAVLAGFGGFQVVDGVVDHKLLGVHQIRYGVPVAPYDITWIAVAALCLLAGVVLLVRTRRTTPTGTTPTRSAPTGTTPTSTP